MHVLPRPFTKTAFVAALAAICLLTLPASSLGATGTVTVIGSVTCPGGEKFAGAWVNSSGGKSDFATKTVMPGTSGEMARIARTLSSVTLPTTITLNVGCGIVNGNKWKRVYNDKGPVKATGSGTVFINLGCTTTNCVTAKRGTGRDTNPIPTSDQCQCTYRAANFWKEMTGSFPSWSGNAGYWDEARTGAPSVGWEVRSWPEPDSLMVWQPVATTLPVGHVGYVADIRDNNGVREVKIYDRNWKTGAVQDTSGCWNRSGSWLPLPAGARFIRVPPRYTSRVR